MALSRKRIPALAGMIAVLLCLWMSPGALAAESGDVTWSVRPADSQGANGDSWTELTLEPGTETTEYLELSNHSNHPVSFRVYAADGYFTDKGRFNMGAAAEEPAEAGSWITVDDVVTVESKDSVIMPYTVRVPDKVTPGDHAAGIAASVQSESQMEDGSTIGVDTRVGFRVMVRVPGSITPELTLQSATAAYRQSWNPLKPGTAQLTYMVENTGNTRLTFSESVAKGSDQGESRGELLPGESRTITVSLGSMWPLFTKAVPLEITPGLVGVDDGLSTEPTPVTQDVRLWMLPLPQGILLLGLALIVGAVVYRAKARRRRLNEQLRAAREEGRREAQEEVSV